MANQFSRSCEKSQQDENRASVNKNKINCRLKSNAEILTKCVWVAMLKKFFTIEEKFMCGLEIELDAAI